MGVLEYGDGLYGIGRKQGKQKKGHTFSMGQHIEDHS